MRPYERRCYLGDQVSITSVQEIVRDGSDSHLFRFRLFSADFVAVDALCREVILHLIIENNGIQK